MKALPKLLILFFTVFLLCENSFCQGMPPWAPAHGYRAKTRYIYFPKENFYYDWNTRNYLYLDGKNWAVKATLPKLIGINLRKSIQIELDFTGEKPYRFNTLHLAKYQKKKTRKNRKEEDALQINPVNHAHKHGHSISKGNGHRNH